MYTPSMRLFHIGPLGGQTGPGRAARLTAGGTDRPRQGCQVDSALSCSLSLAVISGPTKTVPRAVT